MTHDTAQRIRMKAYEIWLLEGRPEGREARHWEMAKEFISGEETRYELFTREPDVAAVREAAAVRDRKGDAPALKGHGQDNANPAPAKKMARSK